MSGHIHLCGTLNSHVTFARLPHKSSYMCACHPRWVGLPFTPVLSVVTSIGLRRPGTSVQVDVGVKSVSIARCRCQETYIYVGH